MAKASTSYTIADLNDGTSVHFLNTSYSGTQSTLESWGQTPRSWSLSQITSDYTEVRVGDTCWMRCSNTTKDGYTYVGLHVSEITTTEIRSDGAFGILDKGDKGISLTNITEHYLASSEDSGITIQTSGWDTVTDMTPTLKYLWNYETMTYSEGDPINTTPRIVGYYKDKGIKSVTEYYALSQTTTKPAKSAFTQEIQIMTPTNKYLWNYTETVYTDDTSSGGYASATIIGAYGQAPVIDYALSESQVDHPAGGYLVFGEDTYLTYDDATLTYSLWHDGVVQESGKFVWMRTLNPDGTYTYACLTGAQGPQGLQGANGYSSAQVRLLKRSQDTPSRYAGGAVTYTFETGAVTFAGSDSDGWSVTPPGGDGDLYVIYASAHSQEATDVIAPNEFTPPVIFSNEASQGQPGYSVCTVFIYKRSSTQPTLPVAQVTYTFEGGVISGLTNGWTKDIPSGTDTLWVSTATAFSQESTDYIDTDEWATPQEFGSKGAKGDTGPRGPAGQNGSDGVSYWIEKSASMVSKDVNNSGALTPTQLVLTAKRNVGGVTSTYTSGVISLWDSADTTETPIAVSSNGVLQFNASGSVSVYTAILSANSVELDSETIPVIETGLNGTNATQYYSYIRYATDSSGSGMTDTPTQSTTFIGTYFGTQSNPAATAYKWSKYVGTDGTNATQYYTYIRYSMNADGRNYVETPTSQTKYVGYYVGTSSTPPVYDNSGWKWSKYVGNDGTDSVVAILTNDSAQVPADSAGNVSSWINATTTIEIYSGSTKVTPTSYGPHETSNCTIDANNTSTVNVTAMSSDSALVVLKAVYNSKTYSKTFTVTKQKQGIQGIQGIQGEQGKSGKDGKDGTNGISPTVSKSGSTVTIVDAAGHSVTISDGEDGFSPTVSKSGNTVTITDADGNTVTVEDGANGQPGAAGSNSYLHIAWANSADGTVDFSTTSATNKQYIGTYSDANAPDSTMPADYKWAKIKGDKGDVGNTGKGISSVDYTYATSQTQTGQKTAYDTAIPPLSSKNKYLWQKEVISYTDGSTPKETEAIIAVYGDTGLQGNGISGIVYKYKATQDQTSPDPSTITSDDIPPLSSKNKYLWQKEVISYTDGTPKTEVALIAVYGDKGDAGVSFSGITEHYLASSESSGVTTKTTGWDVDTEMSPTLKYLWNYETISKSDKSSIDTTPRIVGYYKDKGISAMDEYYATSQTTSKPAIKAFSTTRPTLDGNTKKYLWNFTLITYTDGSYNYSDDTQKLNAAVVIGVYGDAGENGSTITYQYALVYAGATPVDSDFSDERDPDWFVGYTYWQRLKIVTGDETTYSEPFIDESMNDIMNSLASFEIESSSASYEKDLRSTDPVGITLTANTTKYYLPTFSWTVNGISYTGSSVSLSYTKKTAPDSLSISCEMASVVNSTSYTVTRRLVVNSVDVTEYSINYGILESDPTGNFVEGDSYVKQVGSDYLPYVYTGGAWSQISNISCWPTQIAQIRDVILANGINIPVTSAALYGYFKNLSAQQAQIDTISTSEITLQEGGMIKSKNYAEDSSGNPTAGFKIEAAGNATFVNANMVNSNVSGSFTSNPLETQEAQPSSEITGSFSEKVYSDRDTYAVIADNVVADQLSAVSGTYGGTPFTKILRLENDTQRTSRKTLASRSGITGTNSLSGTMPVNGSLFIDIQRYRRSISKIIYSAAREASCFYRIGSGTRQAISSDSATASLTAGQTATLEHEYDVSGESLTVGAYNNVVSFSGFFLSNYAPRKSDNSRPTQSLLEVNGKLFVAAGYTSVWKGTGGSDWQKIAVTTDTSDTTSDYRYVRGLLTDGVSVLLAIGPHRIYKSDLNGESWTLVLSRERDGVQGFHDESAVCYGGGEFRVAGRGNTGTYYSSTDGVHWTTRNFSTAGYVWGLCYGNNTWLSSLDVPDFNVYHDSITFCNGRFFHLYCGSESNKRVELYTSTNGSSWSRVHVFASEAWAYSSSAVAYGNGYYYVGINLNTNTPGTGTGGGIYSSPDGVTWTRINDSNWISFIKATYIQGRMFLTASKGVDFGTFTSSDWVTERTGSLLMQYDHASYPIGANLLDSSANIVRTVPNAQSWHDGRISIPSLSYGELAYRTFLGFISNGVSVSSFDARMFVSGAIFGIIGTSWSGISVNITSSSSGSHSYNLKWNGSVLQIILNGTTLYTFTQGEHFVDGVSFQFTPMGQLDAILVKDVLPKVDSQYTLGASGNEFIAAYINDVYGNLTGNVVGNLTGTASNARNANYATSAGSAGSAASATTAGTCTGNAATSTQWATASNIRISDGTNNGNYVTINGNGQNITIVLPSKIYGAVFNG